MIHWVWFAVAAVVGLTLVVLRALAVAERVARIEADAAKGAKAEAGVPRPPSETRVCCIDSTGKGVSVVFGDGRRYWSGETVVWWDDNAKRELDWDEANKLKTQLRGLLAEQRLTLHDLVMRRIRLEFRKKD